MDIARRTVREARGPGRIRTASRSAARRVRTFSVALFCCVFVLLIAPASFAGEAMKPASEAVAEDGSPKEVARFPGPIPATRHRRPRPASDAVVSPPASTPDRASPRGTGSDLVLARRNGVGADLRR